MKCHILQRALFFGEMLYSGSGVTLMKPKVLTEDEIAEMLTKVTEEELKDCESCEL